MRVKNILFMLFLFDLFLVLWGLMVAVQTFLIDADILKFPEENVRLLFILFFLFVVTSMAGLVFAIMYDKKYYIKLFPALQVVVFIAMLFAKSLFG
ncbi:MAG TPA: hypothetical protein ENK93_00330 [Campylobacteraceae bacterium]|jgi:hypothetical protein|nr:hypothetical protein [Campylobacterota bacterium]HHD83301.1 hypothetical protein [Campylobacteraceae bacterium]